DHRVGVGVEAGRVLGVGVARAEAAAQVIHLEGAQLGDRLDGRGQLFDVEQLRADVRVYAVQPQLGAALDAGDRLPRVVGHQPELGAGVTGGLRGVGLGLDAGDHPHQAGLLAAGGHDALQPVDVV